MTTLSQLMAQKGHALWSIHPEESVFDAIKGMANKDIGALLVMQGGQLVGIVTERHYARIVVLKGKTSPDTTVRQIMEHHVVSVGPEDTVDECMELMTERRVHYLVVVRNGRPIGLLSIGDLVKSIISEQRFTIGHLEHYIHGQMAVG